MRISSRKTRKLNNYTCLADTRGRPGAIEPQVVRRGGGPRRLLSDKHLHAHRERDQKHSCVGCDYYKDQHHTERKPGKQIERTLDASAGQFENSGDFRQSHRGKQNRRVGRRVVNPGREYQHYEGRQESEGGANRQGGAPIQETFPLPPGHTSSLATSRPTRHLLRFVHGLPADHGAQDPGIEKLLRDCGSDVAVKNNKVSQHAGNHLAFFFFRKLGKC